MELLTIKIKPLSAFATIPKGDTIFGQILSYLFLKNDKIFENYLNEEPKLIVSDMMPFGYIYKPHLPLDYFANGSQEIDKKELRRKEFIAIENLQNGNLHLCEKVDFQTKNSVVKNSINRTTFTTDGADFTPYGNLEITYSRELWMFILVDIQIKDKILQTLQEIGKFGFGKEANTGKGTFEIEVVQTPFKDVKSNYYMSISPTILEGQDFKNVWYEPFTRFGKFGLDNAHENAFKKPVLMANSGAVINSDKPLQYFGKAVNNGNIKPSFLQGYSIAIPFTIKDEKCLNTK
jgi:CRISPR-associated protein Csm4